MWGIPPFSSLLLMRRCVSFVKFPEIFSFPGTYPKLNQESPPEKNSSRLLHRNQFALFARHWFLRIHLPQRPVIIVSHICRRFPRYSQKVIPLVFPLKPWPYPDRKRCLYYPCFFRFGNHWDAISNLQKRYSLKECANLENPIFASAKTHRPQHALCYRFSSKFDLRRSV